MRPNQIVIAICVAVAGFPARGALSVRLAAPSGLTCYRALGGTPSFVVGVRCCRFGDLVAKFGDFWRWVAKLRIFRLFCYEQDGFIVNIVRLLLF